MIAKIKPDYIFHLASRASPKDYQEYPVETALAYSVGTDRMAKLALAKNAKILADNLPKNIILHFAGETPFVIDGETSSIFYVNGDMEDWAINDFDISMLEKTTQEHLEEECLLSLQGYAWRESMRRILPQINAEVFGEGE